jgi:hypothetical protein
MATFPELTTPQKLILKAWIARHGRSWKIKLREVWAKANPDDEGRVLYRLRNTHGPEWLDKIQVPF